MMMLFLSRSHVDPIFLGFDRTIIKPDFSPPVESSKCVDVFCALIVPSGRARAGAGKGHDVPNNFYARLVYCVAKYM